MLNYLMIAANAGNNTNPGGSLLTMLLPFAFIILIMYFLVMRPESKRKKQAEEMRNNLKKGDWITTIGGIYGASLPSPTAPWSLRPARTVSVWSS